METPLRPLPVIDTPYNRIGMDMVGPLPRTKAGNKHILVIVDYATRWPEAIILIAGRLQMPLLLHRCSTRDSD